MPLKEQECPIRYWILIKFCAKMPLSFIWRQISITCTICFIWSKFASHLFYVAKIGCSNLFYQIQFRFSLILTSQNWTVISFTLSNFDSLMFYLANFQYSFVLLEHVKNQIPAVRKPKPCLWFWNIRPDIRHGDSYQTYRRIFLKK